MDDAQRWVAIAADVLGEPDPRCRPAAGRGLRAGGTYLTVRETGPAPRRDEVALYPRAGVGGLALWRPPSGAALDHPL